MATAARFTGASNSENTSVSFMNDYLAPAYAATIALAIKPTAAKTVIQPAVLTGAVTFTANVGNSTAAPFVGDHIRFYLVSDGTTRTATFGTGFLPTGTLAVTTAKYATIGFEFNGTGWIETGRAVSA